MEVQAHLRGLSYNLLLPRPMFHVRNVFVRRAVERQFEFKRRIQSAWELFPNMNVRVLLDFTRLASS